MGAASGGLSSGWHTAAGMLSRPIGMPGTAWCTGTGGSETAEATEGLFAASSQDDNEGTEVQGVIKSHCPITDNTPITSHPADVLHNMRLLALKRRFASSQGRRGCKEQL